MNFDNIKHFKSFEFDSSDSPGSGLMMNQEFVERLDKMRDSMGMPLSVVSGFRTPAHNNAVGGEPNSAHLRGLAVDFAAIGSSSRAAIVIAAVRAGFNRIGIGTSFVHLDADTSLPQFVFWLYPPTETRS